MTRPLPQPVVAGESASGRDPDAACAPCHRAIYERYKKTPMANATGAADDGFIAADFEHAVSGIHYRITHEEGHVWLSYERNDFAHMLSGRQELRYFLGSGRRGRTYLFEQQGYWFEAPINWYAKKQVWDMAPNYLDAHEMPLTLPVDPGCLHCHASGAAPALPDARNHYESEPFAEGGITCAACHGDKGRGGLADPLAGGFGTLSQPNPVRTVGSYWPYAPTLFDFIRRAMPFNAPESLDDNQVYAVSAYVLSLNGIVSDDAVLDGTSLPKIAMPNRNGFVRSSK